MLRQRLWKAPQAIFTMFVAPATLFGERSTFIEKSPQGSPHVQTCTCTSVLLNWLVHCHADRQDLRMKGSAVSLTYRLGRTVVVRNIACMGLSNIEDSKIEHQTLCVPSALTVQFLASLT